MVCRRLCASVCEWRLADNLWESVLLLLSWSGTQVVRLNGKYLQPEPFHWPIGLTKYPLPSASTTPTPVLTSVVSVGQGLPSLLLGYSSLWFFLVVVVCLFSFLRIFGGHSLMQPVMSRASVHYWGWPRTFNLPCFSSQVPRSIVACRLTQPPWAVFVN